MSHKLMYKILLLGWFVWFSPVAIATGDPEAGKTKAKVCMSCHGVDGNSQNPAYPKLAGQLEDYLVKQTMDFKTGKRKDEIMSAMIQLISAPSDLFDIAAYYAAQPVMAGAPVATAKDKIERGAELFRNERCIFCHDEGAKPTGPFNPDAPVIGGQHKQYLIKAMMDIRSQKRSGDIYNLMYKTLSRLTKEDIEVIAEYLSSL